IQEGTPTQRLEAHLIGRACEDPIKQRPFDLQRLEYALLDTAPRYQVNNLHRPVLAHAVNPSDALLKDCRVPRHLQVDHRVGRLEVETSATCIRTQKDPAARVIAKPLQ